MRRDRALALGGFDENFVRVAYNFEAEFSNRVKAAGEEIFFQPLACINHLKASTGGTRSYGEHLVTTRPDHAVGAYYYILRCSKGVGGLVLIFRRAVSSVITRHHLRYPWWIPLSLVAELRGFIWALRLSIRGPKYIQLDQMRSDIEQC